jgi:hypothetical protein
MPTDHIDELRTMAKWSRQRRDLYRAKEYGPRTTSPERMRELERELARADERLDAAIAAKRDPNPA